MFGKLQFIVQSNPVQKIGSSWWDDMGELGFSGGYKHKLWKQSFSLGSAQRPQH